MSSQICINAGILLKVLLPEPDSILAESLWQSCIANQVALIAPQLLPFEVPSLLRQLTYRGLLEPALAETLVRKRWRSL